MDLTFPVANVTCHCGVLLWSWKDVTAHWDRHRNEREGMERAQDMLNEIIRGARSGR